MQCPTPAAPDIERFRVWLQEHKPLAKDESRFLDDASDLLSFATPVPIRCCRNSTLTIPIYVGLGVLVPLLFFKLITGLLNKLIVLALATIAAHLVADKLGSLKAKVHQAWSLACTGIALFAAVLL